MIDLAAFREAVVGDARDEAAKLRSEAEADAAARVDDARDEAEEVLGRARQRGRDDARRQLQRRLAEGRQQAREEVLRARREALDELRARALAELEGRRGSDEYRQLRARLEQVARQQLGNGADVAEDADDGGVVARAGGRHVDYRLPVLVDRVVDDMADEVEELWR